MSKLFIVYLGGSAPKANIELHDIQFVVADKIEDTYQQLISNWFGDTKGLHLDSYKHIQGADGYKISLKETPALGQKNVYFVNLGGYQKDKLNELHEFALLVASNPNEAKNKAKKVLLTDASHQHKDNLMEVDDCLKINCINGMYIHLEPTEEVFDLQPDWFGYKVISTK